MKKASYTLIIISIIAFLLFSIEIVGDFELLRVKLYGSVLLFALTIGSILNFIAKHKK